MSGRTLIAIAIGLLLGYIFGFYVANSGYAAPLPLLLGGALNPLLVYRIADRNALWVSVVPNVMLVLTVAVVEWQRSPERPFQTLAVLMGSIIMALFALLASAPSYWVRNRAGKVKGKRRKEAGKHF